MRQRPGIGWHDGGQESPAPTHNMWAFAAGDRKGRPYGSITKGACIVGRQGEGTPPYGCMAGSAVGRATARVAPTGGQGVRDGGPMWASAPTERSKGAVERVVEDADPYGAQQGGGGAGRRGRRPLRSAARGRWSRSSRTPAPTERSKGAVERVVKDADPYGCMIRGRVRWGRKKGPRKRSLKI